MFNEQIIDREDLGEIVLGDAKIRDEQHAAACLVAQLPYYYLFSGEQMKHSKIESFLNKIDPKTGLSHRVLAARLIHGVGGPESEDDMNIVFVRDNGERFTQIGFKDDKNPVIIVDLNYKRPRLSLIAKVVGTNTPRFTSDMLLNIFDTFVKIQIYRDENLAEN